MHFWLAQVPRFHGQASSPRRVTFTCSRPGSQEAQGLRFPGQAGVNRFRASGLYLPRKKGFSVRKSPFSYPTHSPRGRGTPGFRSPGRVPSRENLAARRAYFRSPRAHSLAARRVTSHLRAARFPGLTFGNCARPGSQVPRELARMHPQGQGSPGQVLKIL